VRQKNVDKIGAFAKSTKEMVISYILARYYFVAVDTGDRHMAQI
jgi:hypothetical protein